MKKGKHKIKKKGTLGRKIIRTIFVLIFIISIIVIAVYIYKSNKEKQDNENILEQIKIDTEQITEEKTERVLQVEELKKENEEIIGWLEIAGTNINYPVCQAKDNDYYLTHNYKKEKASTGSIFLDKDFDLINGSSNYLIYGHRNKQGLMFEDLIKYRNKNFYEEHPTIKFTTTTSEDTYEIISVFESRVYYKSEQNVFRYYYFVNAETEQEYNNFVEESKKASIYDTGKTANYGEQLLTLSTCEYSQENGRFVIVAKKIK